MAGNNDLPGVIYENSVNTRKDSVFNQAERQTRLILGQIQARLKKRLAQSFGSFTDSLRMTLINIAMWPQLAPLSQDFLTFLGDSEKGRKWFAFIMPFVKWMSEPFLFPVETGGTMKEQAKEVDKMFTLMDSIHKQGMTVTLDNVGDESLSPEDARSYQNYYATLVRSFVESDRGNELYLSLKLSALVHDLDAAKGSGEKAEAKKREITEALTGLLSMAAKAKGKTVFIRIDMEQYCYKDLTLGIFKEIVENAPLVAIAPNGNLRLGLVIQAYLRDSAEDMKALVKWAKSRNLRIPIRLVKGAYLEHERRSATEQGCPSPVWDNKSSTDANYEALSACMLLNLNTLLPAFATHNIRTQAHAIALAETYGLPGDVARIQMLYGMGDPIKQIITEMGRPMREYIPAGSLARGLKYSGRRFEELSNSDNALAKTMRGDFSSIDGSTPVFKGEQDKADSMNVQAFLRESLTQL